MVEELKRFIHKHQLFEEGDSILLAVSGGMDSMVMCDLFHRAGFSFGIAHCNFSLRGGESDEDEEFVRQSAEKMKVLFASVRFYTRKHAEDKGISIQMAARELRYEWFVKTAAEKGYDFIATAHHLDDQIETFFINLNRLSGIAGFHGIFPKKDKIIRPMLFCDRQRIAEYAASRKIVYREDSSNNETKYLRNKIRHEIIPLFRQINPEFNTILTGNIQRLRETEIIFRQHIEQVRKTLIRKQKNQVIIPIEELQKLEPLATYTFELLCRYGFNFSTASDIATSLDRDPGITWFSPEYRLIKDRTHLILTPLQEHREENVFEIPLSAKKVNEPVHLVFSILPRDHDFEIDNSPFTANLDLNKLEFPLTIRKWRKGDTFHPFGSGHRKKLSDFFTDNKFSIADKENIWLLCSGDDIIWVIGKRINHKYRITSATKEVYMIRFKD